MGRLTYVLAGLLVACSVLSVQLWRNLQAERLMVAALLDGSASTHAANARLQPAAGLGARGSIAAPQGGACFGSSPEGGLPAEEFVARMESLVARIPATISGMPQDKDLLKDEEYRKARLAQVRIAEAYSNPGLAEALGLTEFEANSLFERMARYQMDVIDEVNDSPKGQLVGAALFDMARRHGMAQEDLVRSQLGEARYAQLLEYRRNTRPGLVRLANISNMLSSAGQPLTDAQSRALTAAIAGEQQRRQQRPGSSSSIANPATPKSAAQALADAQNRREHEDRSFLDAIAPSLTAAQLELLRKQLEQQGTADRRNLEIVKGD